MTSTSVGLGRTASSTGPVAHRARALDAAVVPSPARTPHSDLLALQPLGPAVAGVPHRTTR